jgi:tRNA(Ile2) C34 agmatinyltransferase TiaS
MELEQRRAEWGSLAEEVGRELAEWRAAHPRATLAEIEEAVLTAMERLQARVLGDLAEASATADLARVPARERPPCPSCGGRLEPAGRQDRAVQPARQRAPLRLRRSYAVCAACGGGLFPPG